MHLKTHHGFERMRLARAPQTGAIVASVNTQGPYGEDWIRDGAFIHLPRGLMRS